MTDRIVKKLEELKKDQGVSQIAINKLTEFVETYETQKNPKVLVDKNSNLLLEFKTGEYIVNVKFDNNENRELFISSKNRFVKDSSTFDKIPETLKRYGINLNKIES